MLFNFFLGVKHRRIVYKLFLSLGFSFLFFRLYINNIHASLFVPFFSSVKLQRSEKLFEAPKGPVRSKIYNALNPEKLAYESRREKEENKEDKWSVEVPRTFLYRFLFIYVNFIGATRIERRGVILLMMVYYCSVRRYYHVV